MSKVQVFFCADMSKFYFTNDVCGLAEQQYRAGMYQPGPELELDFKCTPQNDGNDVPEEAFDLSNNPSRQDERTEKYGRHNRSLSVGDIVRLDNMCWVCKPVGWSYFVM